MMLMIATALLNTTWWLVLATAAVYVAGTEIRIRSEERLLGARFGPAFDEYRRQVPAFLPPLR
jgi:protein-S-isoprenylcysteine O-methyltransferase Ste14